MIETYLDANYSSSSSNWADALITEIQSGAYEADAASWLACSSTTEVLSDKRSLGGSGSVGRRTALSLALTEKRSLEREIREFLASSEKRKTDATVTITPLECPIVWARESNAYDCVRLFAFFLFCLVWM